MVIDFHSEERRIVLKTVRQKNGNEYNFKVEISKLTK